MTRKIRTLIGGSPEHEPVAGRQPHPSEQQHENDAEAQRQSQASTQRSSRNSHGPCPPHVRNSLTLLNVKSKTHTHIIPAAHGHAFLVPAGKSFRMVDLHGAQVVDLMAWTSPGDPSGQHSSMSYTRYNISGSAPPQVGECIHTNLGQAMLKLTADTVKTHDMLYMACNPSFYANMNLRGHRNCAENISGAVSRAGFVSDGKEFGWNQVVDPFNVFQNTPYYSLKALGASKAGDYCEWKNVLGKDVVVGLSCCPFEGDGFNGGKVTEVAVVVEAE